MLDIHQINTIIFDLDGLILDTESTFHSAWKQAGEALGVPINDGLLQDFCGMSGNDITRLLKLHYGERLDIDRFFNRCEKIWIEQVKQQGIAVKPGFFALIDVVRHNQWEYTIATNSRRTNAQFCLETAGIANYFTDMVCREDVVNPKPSSEVFVKAAALLNKELTECMVLEDSPPGVRAAYQTHAKTVYIPSTVLPDRDCLMMADIYCKDMNQLASILTHKDHV